MNTYPFAAVAEEHRSDLLRAAGCCSPLPAHRRALCPSSGADSRIGSARLRRAADPLLRMRTARIDGDTALIMSCSHEAAPALAGRDACN